MNQPTGFMWRDRHRNYHHPTQMETHHLFYTLRMIWNHSAPSRMKIRPYRKYRFSFFYSNEYMLQAVKHLLKELNSRSNELTSEHLDTIYFMFYWGSEYEKALLKED